MKSTITTIATALLVISTFSSFASTKHNPLKKLSSFSIINTYLEATTTGNNELNKFLFADDFEYRNSMHKKSYGKKEYTGFLKKNKGLKYDCVTQYEILDESGDACIAKATMTFKNFTRTDYITLNRDNDGWKVSKVVTTYP